MKAPESGVDPYFDKIFQKVWGSVSQGEIGFSSVRERAEREGITIEQASREILYERLVRYAGYEPGKYDTDGNIR